MLFRSCILITAAGGVQLLDPAFAGPHAGFLARVMRDRALPASIQHPLRNVHMVRSDGSTVQVRANPSILSLYSLSFSFPSPTLPLLAPSPLTLSLAPSIRTHSRYSFSHV